MTASDGRNSSALRRISPYAVSVLCAFLLAPFLTVALSPVWNWFETFSGIESMGHSGPAGWCFVLVFFFLLILLAVARWFRQGKNE